MKGPPMTDDEILSANERDTIAQALRVAEHLDGDGWFTSGDVIRDLIALTERLATDAARLSAERERLRESATAFRAASKRAGHDLLKKEADEVLHAFTDHWEPLKAVAERAEARSASWLASRARNLAQRGLIESRWVGNDRTSSFKMWRLAVPNPPTSAEREKRA